MSALKTLFCVKKKRPKKKTVSDFERSRLKNLEVFRPLPNNVVQQIEDIKLTLGQKPLDRRQFDTKLNSFVKYLTQNDVLREYVHRVYSKNQQHSYCLVTEELLQICEELSYKLKNMVFFNTRNARVAEMVTEIALSSKQLDEKRKQVYTNAETVLQNRMAYKWSILKTSTDIKLLEKFLNEVVGQIDEIEFRQKQAVMICNSMRDLDSSKTKYLSICNDDDATMGDDDHCEDDEDVIDDVSEGWPVT